MILTSPSFFFHVHKVNPMEKLLFFMADSNLVSSILLCKKTGILKFHPANNQSIFFFSSFGKFFDKKPFLGLHQAILIFCLGFHYFREKKQEGVSRSEYMAMLGHDMSIYYGFLPELIEMFLHLFNPAVC